MIKNRTKALLACGIVITPAIMALNLEAQATQTGVHMDACPKLSATGPNEVPCSAVTNLANGNFELPLLNFTDVDQTSIVNVNEIASWQTDASLNYVSTDQEMGNNQAVELGNNKISQDIKVSPGQILKISFDMKSRYLSEEANDKIDLQINDQSILEANSNSTTWTSQQVSYQVPADYDSSKLLRISLNGVEVVSEDGISLTEGATSGNIIDNLMVSSQAIFDNVLNVDQIDEENDLYRVSNVLVKMSASKLSTDSYIEYSSNENGFSIDPSSLTIDGNKVSQADIGLSNGVYKISNITKYLTKENNVISFDAIVKPQGESTEIKSDLIYHTAGLSEYEASQKFYLVSDTTKFNEETITTDMSDLGSITNEIPTIDAQSITVYANGDYSAEPEDVLAEHKVFAHDLEDGIISDKVVITGLDKVDLAKTGRYPLTFTITDEMGNVNAISKSLNVIEEDKQVVSNGNVGLYGSDFVTNHATIAANNDSLANLISYILSAADINGFDVNSGLEAKVNLDHEDLNQISGSNKPGDYQLKLIATIGTQTVSKTITVSILENNSELDPNLPYVYAENLVLDLNEPITTDLEKFKVYAYDKQDKNITAQAKLIGIEQVNTKKMGVYPIKVQVMDKDGNITEKEVHVFVKDPNVHYKEGDYALKSHDFIFNELSLAKHNVEQLENYIRNTGNVSAFNIKTNEISEYVIDQDQLLAALNSRNLGYRSINIYLPEDENKVPIGSIGIVVLPSGVSLSDTDPYLYATDAYIALGKLYGPKLHKLFAYDKVDGHITQNIKYQGFDKIDISKAGEYPVTISITNSQGNTSSLTRTVHVIDLDNLTPEQEKEITGLDLDGVTEEESVNPPQVQPEETATDTNDANDDTEQASTEEKKLEPELVTNDESIKEKVINYVKPVVIPTTKSKEDLVDEQLAETVDTNGEVHQPRILSEEERQQEIAKTGKKIIFLGPTILVLAGLLLYRRNLK